MMRFAILPAVVSWTIGAVGFWLVADLRVALGVGLIVISKSVWDRHV